MSLLATAMIRHQSSDASSCCNQAFGTLVGAVVTSTAVPAWGGMNDEILPHFLLRQVPWCGLEQLTSAFGSLRSAANTDVDHQSFPLMVLLTL